MSKTLTLIRHAKSSWESPGLRDFDRPLNRRGQQDAPMMGERLAATGFLPDIILSSPARRAIETARIIASRIGCPEEHIIQREEIYEAWITDLLAIIHSLDDGYQSATLVGHNPGLTALCNNLSNNQRIGNLPTCGIWQMRFDTEDWSGITPGSGQLLLHDYPKKPA